jgi:hypothetical protein
MACFKVRRLLRATGGINVTGDLTVSGTLDFNGALDIDNTLTIGEDGTGYDVLFYGDTADAHMHWDADTDLLHLDGTTSKFQIGDFTGATSGTGTVVSGTNTAALKVFTDDGGAAITSGYLVRAGWFRNLQTYTGGNREQEACGVQGSIVSVAGTNRHNMCGVLGSYEARTSLIVDGQAASTDTWCQAGVIGRVGMSSGTLTLNTNGVLAGVAAMSNINTAVTQTYTGEYAAFYAGAWANTDDWEIGLLIEDGKCTTGIDIGTCTTGMTITGATGYAIDIQTTGQFRMGIQGTGIPTASATPFAMEIHSETGEALTAGLTGLSCGIRSRYEISVAQPNQISLTAIEGRLRVKANVADGTHSGVSGTIESDGAITYTGTGTTQWNAGNFCVELGASCVFTGASGWLTGITIDSSINATQTDIANITFPALRIKKSSGKLAWQYGIYIDGAAATVAIQTGADASDGGDVIFYGAATGELFNWDSSAATLDLTSTTTAADDMVSIYQTNTSTASSGYHRTLYVLADHDGDMTGSASMEALGVDMVIQDDVDESHSISCWTGFFSSATMSHWSMFYGHADALVTTAATIAMLDLNMVTSTRSSGDVMAFIRLYSHTGPNGMKQVFYMEGTGTIADYFIQTGGATAKAPFTATSSGGATRSHRIACKIGGVVGYLSLYTD